MGWIPEPRFNERNNSWTLKYKVVTQAPSGPKVKARHYLCYGRGSYLEACVKARQIMGLQPDAPLGNAAKGIGKGISPARPVVVSELIVAWSRVFSPSQWTVDILAGWDRVYGTMPLAEVDADHLTMFKSHLESHPTGWDRSDPKFANHPRRTPSAKTVADKVKAARRVLEWGRRRGYCVEVDMPVLDEPNKAPKDYSHEQLLELWSVLVAKKCRRKAEPAMRLMVETGARPAEVCNMDWSHVDLANAMVVLYEHKTAHSTGEPRRVPLTPAAIEVLTARPTRDGPVFTSRLGKRYTPAGLRSIIRRAALKAGLTNTRLYGLRHTRAQTMLEQGCNLEEVGHQLGQKDLRVTQRYCQVRDGQAKAVASRLVSPLQPGSAPGTQPHLGALAGVGRTRGTTRRARKRRSASSRAAS